MDATERYRIEEALGAGGMGVVYRALDTTLGRPVAVKKLHPHLTKNKDLVARFKAEARAAARLEHPNIVAVHDVGEHDGELFFTMQFVEGESLRSVLDRVRVLPIDQLLWVGQQLAS
ncbi:MAG: protein kinase, partial [Myxococcota bacterium]|nr:protein kinase [Myxococcota bacterium]